MLEWLTINWKDLALPVAALLVTYIVGMWLRGVIFDIAGRRAAETKWNALRESLETIYRAFPLWFLLLGVVIAIQISVLPPQAKKAVAAGGGSLFVISLAWLVASIAEHLIRENLSIAETRKPVVTIGITVIRVTVIIVAALVVFDVWGLPTTPLLMLIAVAVLVGALVFRNTAPNLFSGLQLSTTQQVKVGDYIKLESGEEGYVTDIGWGTTRVKGLDESIIIIPNSRLLQQTVINYGHPLKKAREPFHFHSRTHIPELTGLRARNLRQLADILKTAPDSVVYYHTHRFLEQQHYMTPEPSNDFAVWVNDALGDDVLSEVLASVDTFGFPTLAALRERLVSIIEGSLSAAAETRQANPGHQFHFMTSVSVVFPTPYVVHDLREFAETLRQISLGSLYFHIFESRLRLGKGMNDFSTWIQDNLDDADLAGEIARLDPYTFTLEGLRSALIQLIEKRIK